MADTPDIKALCEQHWDAWKNDCSGFLKAVARDLGISLNGMANAIIDQMESESTWTNLDTDVDKAKEYAAKGYLVVAGLRANGHGHVAIIMPSDSPAGKAPHYPKGYWGRYGSVGKKDTAISWSWNAVDLPKVKYYARQVIL